MTNSNLFRLGLLSLLVLLGFGCKKEAINAYKGTNEIFVSASEDAQRSTITVDENEVYASVFLTKSLEQDLTLSLTVEQGKEGLISLSSSTVTIPKGQIKATFSIRRATNLEIDEEATLEIGCSLPASMPDLKLRQKLLVRVRPNPLSALTPEQRELVAGYKTKYGLDLSKILGKVVCNGTVYYSGSESEVAFLGQERTYEVKNQTMIVSLSNKSTPDQPVLFFSQNALGLDDYMGQVYNSLTILNPFFYRDPSDPDYANMPPASKYVATTLGWTPKNALQETFGVTLDNVRIDVQDKKTLHFLGQRGSTIDTNAPYYQELYDQDVIVVPFTYKSSIFDKLMELIKKDADALEHIIQGSVLPHQLLNTTKVDEDYYTLSNQSPKSDYISPRATIDLPSGTMTFEFPFDFGEGNGRSYAKVSINCKKVQP